MSWNTKQRQPIDHLAHFCRVRWRGKPKISAAIIEFMEENDVIPMAELCNASHRLRFLWGIYTRHTIDVVAVPLSLWKIPGTGQRRCDIVTLETLPPGFDAIADKLHLQVTHHPDTCPALRYQVTRDEDRGKPDPKRYRITH